MWPFRKRKLIPPVSTHEVEMHTQATQGSLPADWIHPMDRPSEAKNPSLTDHELAQIAHADAIEAHKKMIERLRGE